MFSRHRGAIFSVKYPVESCKEVREDSRKLRLSVKIGSVPYYRIINRKSVKNTEEFVLLAALALAPVGMTSIVFLCDK